MYEIAYTDEALEDLTFFKKHEQNEIIDGIDLQLRYEPNVETRNRKLMRPNEKAGWELRIGNFRVLYDVDTEVRIVEIQKIGKKQGNTFLFRGREENL
jgi:mRNA-degrading endonuclease RelE of RelBE toxin-antitoxin system